MAGPQPQIRKFAVIFCTSTTAMSFYFRKLEPQTLLLFFPGLIDRGDLLQYNNALYFPSRL